MIERKLLCSKNEYTKSESNSQPFLNWISTGSYCVQRTNIQNLKAIHNSPAFKEKKEKLCSKNEYTKSESNSQPTSRPPWSRRHCVQRTNIQNLKAIHNGRPEVVSCHHIVFKERIYKIWKQFTTGANTGVFEAQLCSKNEYTKSESNSQRVGRHDEDPPIVFKERIYKIWKQFTTDESSAPFYRKLCSKNEYTKSESNSQLNNLLNENDVHCVQRTNIQNLKAIHNSRTRL